MFECESNGVPDSVNWYKNDEIITDTSGVRYGEFWISSFENGQLDW